MGPWSPLIPAEMVPPSTAGDTMGGQKFGSCRHAEAQGSVAGLKTLAAISDEGEDMRLLLLVPALAGGISYATPITKTRIAPTLERPATSHEPMGSCEGGAEYPLELEMQRV